MAAIAIVTAGAAGLVAQSRPPRDARPVAADATPTGAIRGVVLSETEGARPLRYARVVLTGAPGGDREVATGDEGKFAFAVPPGRYTVRASKDAYVPMAYGASAPNRVGTPVEVRNGETTDIAIRLPRGAVITGVVTDPDGAPRQIVIVMAQRFDFNPTSGRRELRPAQSGTWQVSTDDRGVYRLFGLPAGEYVVGAISMPTSPVIRLQQLSQSDVQRALLELRGTAATQDAAAGAPRTVTPVAVYYPGVTSGARAARVAVRAGEERTGIDIPLQYAAAASISGAISNQPEGLQTRVSLIARDPETVWTSQSKVLSPEGQFAFRNVAPGAYLLIAQAGPRSDTGEMPGSLWAAADLSVDGDDVTNVALSLQPTVSLSGRLVFEGAAPLPDGGPRSLRTPLVFFRGHVPIQGLPLEVRGDRFSIGGIVPGTYQLQSELPGIRTPVGRWWLTSVAAGGRELLDAPIELRQSVDDAVATFTDKPSELSGNVIDRDGSAAVSLWVVAFSADPHHWFFHSRRVAGIMTDPQGRYTIKNLPAGDYLVATTTEIEDREWYYPEVLERLVPVAARVRMAEGEARSTANLQLPTANAR